MAQTLTGSSLQLLMNIETYWRQLVRREEQTAGSAQVSKVTGFFRMKLAGKLERVDDVVHKFASAILAYERTLSSARSPLIRCTRLR